MGVDAKCGRFPICPEMSRFVPVCPLLSFLGPGTGTNRDKRGQTGRKRDISGQIGKHPHLASTPILALLNPRDVHPRNFLFGLFFSFLITPGVTNAQLCPLHLRPNGRTAPKGYNGIEIFKSGLKFSIEIEFFDRRAPLWNPFSDFFWGFSGERPF